MNQDASGFNIVNIGDEPDVSCYDGIVSTKEYMIRIVGSEIPRYSRRHISIVKKNGKMCFMSHMKYENESINYGYDEEICEYIYDSIEPIDEKSDAAEFIVERDGNKILLKLFDTGPDDEYSILAWEMLVLQEGEGRKNEYVNQKDLGSLIRCEGTPAYTDESHDAMKEQMFYEKPFMDWEACPQKVYDYDEVVSTGEYALRIDETDDNPTYVIRPISILRKESKYCFVYHVILGVRIYNEPYVCKITDYIYDSIEPFDRYDMAAKFVVSCGGKTSLIKLVDCSNYIETDIWVEEIRSFNEG